ncbi:MAG: PD-(D/E)XK nuclease family protein, partial [Acidimicrobiia bacterium]|nr:PD-(D/E)XK nuclease family protein [Acidimicrobiia bacterium]
LGGRGLAPASGLGAEAVAARATAAALEAGELQYFGEVARTPGFARGLAQTVGELRLEDVDTSRLGLAGMSGPDLAVLLARIEAGFAAASSVDRATLFRTAAGLVARHPVAGSVVALLDVPLSSAAEASFAAALLAHASEAMATLPAHDTRTAAALSAHLTSGSVDEDDDQGDLASLRRHLFDPNPPSVRDPDGSLTVFSAPGEGRESVEIVRRLLDEAARGVPFDEMAILVRAPHAYHGLLESALDRGGVPAWFDRGTRRPHPAGRAFVALLRCAVEHLSARRFAEYLSLGQVPSPTPADGWTAADDEALRSRATAAAADGEADTMADETGSDRGAATPSPRHWETLIDAASVITGRERWPRRLDGLRAEFSARLAEVERESPELPAARGLRVDLERLDALRAFALPLIDEMAAWPEVDSWARWLERLSAIARRALGTPAHVLRVLADLRPMGPIGDIALPEVTGVLADRLATVGDDPPRHRYGRVYVGTPEQARGRAFRVVFVPGLAERMFPRKAYQDALLLDAARVRLDDRLATHETRTGAERLLLHLAVGAATERLYVSYPRIDVAEARPRVPSFYALDLLRATTGVLPQHDELERAAHAAASATLAWPAPPSAEQAIDDQEYDLAVLRELLEHPDPAAVRGHAHYILHLAPALRRSVRERWVRSEPRWSPSDGLLR